MNDIIIARRIQMADLPNRGDINWVLFRAGNLSAPLAILTDFEMKDLLVNINQQIEDNEGESK